MALFKIDDINSSAFPVARSGSVLIHGQANFWDATQKTIDEHFNKVEPVADDYHHFYSKGAWNMHDLLYYWLRRQGPGMVYLTTWAISEIAMRQLCNFMKDGLITRLYALFDYRNTSRKPAELAFIQKNATEIKLAKCHAKVTVIIPESVPVTIIGSANYTRNPRLETGTVFFGENSARFYQEMIMNEISEVHVK